MLGGLGLTEWVLGGAGVFAVIAAMAIRAFKSERSKRKAAEASTRVQAEKAVVESDASDARIDVITARDAKLAVIAEDVEEEIAGLEEVSRGISKSSLKELASIWNNHFGSAKAAGKPAEDSSDEDSTN